MRTIGILILMISACHCHAQQVLKTISKEKRADTLAGFYYQVTDSSYFLMPAGNCKAVMILPVYKYELTEQTVTAIRIREPLVYAAPVKPQRKPFLTIHGNVMYDFYYQSNSDTPYIEKEIYQHTVQTTLDISVRDQYPLHSMTWPEI